MHMMTFSPWLRVYEITELLLNPLRQLQLCLNVHEVMCLSNLNTKRQQSDSSAPAVVALRVPVNLWNPSGRNTAHFSPEMFLEVFWEEHKQLWFPWRAGSQSKQARLRRVDYVFLSAPRLSTPRDLSVCATPRPASRETLPVRPGPAGTPGLRPYQGRAICKRTSLC